MAGVAINREEEGGRGLGASTAAPFAVVSGRVAGAWGSGWGPTPGSARREEMWMGECWRSISMIFAANTPPDFMKPRS